jgi:hypothetical protein
MTKKQEKFAVILKANRVTLIKHYGFRASTVSMWIAGKRIPTWDNATRMASVLQIPLDSVPYTRVIKNI